VIYGDKQAPLMIAVEPKSIERELHREGFFNHLMKIDVEGSGYDVLPRDVQIDPVTDKPLHLDFLRVGPDSIITVQVPVHFRNEAAAPGIKRGGVLNIVLHEITVRTKPATIPEYFEVDLTGLEIGHSVHISALKVPEGVRLVTSEKNATVASIAAPTVVREAAAEAAAQAAAAAAAPAPGAAAAAARAGPPERHVERHGRAPESFFRAHDDLRAQPLNRDAAEERVAHAIEDAGDRWEINRDLVAQPFAMPE
jgi:large subunit ribosomal protein L25